MINIVLVEDDSFWMNKIKAVINEFRKNKKIEFKFYFFNSYSQELKKFIKLNKEGNTFYIIDIVLKLVDEHSESGLDLINDIRLIDKKSIISLMSADSYLINEAQRKRLNIFDYIYKNDNPMKKVSQDLNDILEMFGLLSGIKFKYEGNYYNLKYSDVNYIKTESIERKCYIFTVKNEYSTRSTLKNIEEQLPSYFIKINRDIIINMNNVYKINLKSNTITFNNNIILNETITQSKRKGVKELCGMK